ncbi:hypothetical protein J3A83DRAFT_4458593 [Scleroderma citrinum]
MTSSITSPPFDMTELDAYARGSPEIGILWHLNVHSGPPYRWYCCEVALLYPHMLLLSWIAPGGDGRGNSGHRWRRELSCRERPREGSLGQRNLGSIELFGHSAEPLRARISDRVHWDNSLSTESLSCAPSYSTNLTHTTNNAAIEPVFATAVSKERNAKPCLGFGLSLVGGTILGDGSPVTVSSEYADRPVYAIIQADRVKPVPR